MNIESVTAAQFLALSDDLAGVYRAVFTRPPWNEPADDAQAFADRLPGETGRDGFRSVIARDDNGTLTGFGYGYLTAAPYPTRRSYDDARTAVGAAGADALSGRFEVLELAVHPAWEGMGIGRRLLTTLVGDQPAWLLTAEHASGAVAFYDACGWQRLGAANGIIVYAR
jgi:ribosomal protein S18 acetylase RimI-like enzyme